MKAKGVTSLLMEVRFPETFPMSPPFFRIVYPRFLPFIRGGGGHVTGGGSLCMDLLTSNGWSPAYKIDAILLQIRLAISNLEPNPARLDPTDWNRPYSMSEAIAGFERAAVSVSLLGAELKEAGHTQLDGGPLVQAAQVEGNEERRLRMLSFRSCSHRRLLCIVLLNAFILLLSMPSRRRRHPARTLG